MLTKAQRAALPPEHFAVPDRRLLPMHDALHARMAWNDVRNVSGLTPEDRKAARERILARAEELNVPTDEWMQLKSVSLSAMSIELPDVPGHPNKMPFSGILTRLDQPSDAPPSGSGGRCVVLTAEAAGAALAGLLGMSVNLTSGMDGHDVKSKVGVITSAEIEGDAIVIQGFIYAADCPDEAKQIQAEKAKLGFSFEAQQVAVEDFDADPLVIKSLVFTGAAILRKDMAAYTTTSLAASKDAEEKDMDELKKMLADLAASVGAVAGELATLKAEAAAKAEAEAAAKADAEKVALAAAADAKVKAEEAAAAELKSVQDAIAAEKTKLADLQAQAAKAPANEPARKTIPAAVGMLMAKAALTLPEGDGKLTVPAVEKAANDAGLNTTQRLALKIGLDRAGVLA